MIYLSCADLFENVLWDFDDKNPISALCNLINDDTSLTLNSELAKIFSADENQSFVIDYLVNRYDRIMSPLFTRLYNKNEEDKEDTSIMVANIIKMKFLFGWNKLAEAMFSDYNPIDNYNMVENKNTDYEEHTVTDSSETTTNKYKGFNSTEMHDVSQSESEGDIDNTKTDSGAKATNELTRRGNIGVTSSQQLIESELTLRKKNVLDQIYRDIDTILFIDYYK